MLVQDASFAKLPKAAPYEFESRLEAMPPLTGDVRSDFTALRGYVESVHRAGGSGHTVVRLMSAAMDRVVGAIWERSLAAAAAAGHASTPVALVALGGYGRRELAPFSDLDLLVLHEKREPGHFVKEASERFLYALWDLRLEVGYGIRDIHACDELAASDHTARTALLDLRHLHGDRELYRELERDQLHGLSQAKVDAFIADKTREARERREKFGDSLYLLEPNLKQSEGGLRDLQMGLWAARARFKVAGITDLLSRALLPEQEVKELRRARDFLWRIRNQLHYATGRKTDQITFDLQPQLATFMGYGEGDGAVEDFMRHYYLAAKTILVASDALVDRCLEPARAKPWRRADALASRKGAESQAVGTDARPLAGGEFKVFRGRLTVADRDVLRRSPAALVRLFATADREGLDLYPFARDLAAQATTEFPAGGASDAELNQELLAMFTRPGTRGRFLTAMHEVGVLERVLPEFARVTARRQIDLYHVYTVDVHSLFAVRRLLALRNGDLHVEVLTPLMQGLAHPLGLYLGTLFHDIGKGSGKDHSTRGAEIAAAACVRMGIDPDVAADVEWLVAKHLRMANIAQRRDLSDPDLIHAFAEEVGTVDRLDKLYLLTYADIATVGPKTWTDWKGRLLRELYEKTRGVLAAGGDRGRPVPGTHEVLGRTAVSESLAARGVPEEERIRFVRAMPARYFLTELPARAPRHLRLLAMGRSRPLAAVVRHRPGLGHSELALTAADRAGLLALVAGVLAAHRIDIQHAEVFSTPDDPSLGWLAGRALDLFELRGPEGGAIDPARWHAARADLQRVLVDAVDLEELMARRLKASPLPARPLPRVATKVVIDNESSRHHSVVDVFTADRVGLLHTLSRTFFDLGLTVDLARVTTEGHRAADAFYVRNREGRRVEGEEARRIAEVVTQALTRN